MMSVAPEPVRRPIRLWPLWLLLGGGSVATAVVRLIPGVTFQDRNLRTILVWLITGLLALVWWLLFSRVSWRRRWLGLLGVVIALGLTKASFRVRGVSGDLLPIIEPRWRSRPALPVAANSNTPTLSTATPAAIASSRPDFPQYLGPSRDTTISGPGLNTNWSQHPPQVLWRIPVGAAWSGFVIVGERILTQEQRTEEELVTCRNLSDGKLLWEHVDAAKYDTVIAGAGPRQTPVVVDGRVYTMGATGILNCLELNTGHQIWRTNILALAARSVEIKSAPGGQRTNVASIPDWGFAGSPLVVDGRVVVQPGGDEGRSLAAFNVDHGDLAWSAGNGGAEYGSPTLLSLAGVRQILVFSTKQISAHDPSTGRILWQHPFGTQFPLVATPLAVGPDRVMISAGYGVGAELLEVNSGTNGTLQVTRVWASRRLKAKFHHPVRRENHVYGLDDGMWACLDLSDGSQPWKGGRYGHGQGLLIGENYLLMAESGELILLELRPDAPRELERYRVFDRKTWNPIALAGNLLLVRNDEEAVLLKLAAR